MQRRRIKKKKELEGTNLVDLYPKPDAESYYQDDLSVINSGTAKLNIDEPWTTPEGVKWVNTSKIPFINEKGEIIGIISLSIDITERKKGERLVQELVHRLEIEREFALKSSMTDGLTLIANRKRFDSALYIEFFRIKRSKGCLSILMLDIDHFKKFNDEYGHLATALESSIQRAADLVARYGGEEFVIILPETDLEGAKKVATRLLNVVEALAIPHRTSETAKHVTVSLGVASVNPAEMETPEQIVKMADDALYCAKKAGRNRFAVAAKDN